MAGDEPIAANTAIAAAKINEQNTRRRRDGVNVRFKLFVFIGVGFVEVRIVQLRDFAFQRSIPETNDEVLKKWLRRVKTVKWLPPSPRLRRPGKR